MWPDTANGGYFCSIGLGVLGSRAWNGDGLIYPMGWTQTSPVLARVTGDYVNILIIATP